MEVGMLWLDNDPRTPLTAKVQRAADYYRLKYGVCSGSLPGPSLHAEWKS